MKKASLGGQSIAKLLMPLHKRSRNIAPSTHQYQVAANIQAGSRCIIDEVLLDYLLWTYC